MPAHLEWIAGALAERTPPSLPADWAEAIAVAASHGVEDVLAHHLRSQGVAIPADLASEVAKRAFLWRVRSARMRSALVEILRAFESGSVRAIPLKGPILAERLYPEGIARPSTDLDLLLDEESLDYALAVLGPLGYTPSDSDARAAYHRKHHYHLGLDGGDDGFLVELHFRAHYTAGSLLEARPLLERAVEYVAGDGESFRVLAPEDEFLFLAAHAGKDIGLNLRLLYDLALFVARHENLDWPCIFERADASGLGCTLALVLADLEAWLGVEAPANPRRRSWRLRRRARATLRRIESERAWPRPVETCLAVAHGALVEDTMRATASHVLRSATRIARRRARRWLPRLVPDSWSG